MNIIDKLWHIRLPIVISILYIMDSPGLNDGKLFNFRNTIAALRDNPWVGRSIADKRATVRLGPPKPDMVVTSRKGRVFKHDNTDGAKSKGN